MRPSVARLLDGIVSTLRDDVIPHVTDPYARGQAVGVIDLLNNFGARLDWDAGQLAANVNAKRTALAEARALTGETAQEQTPRAVTATAELLEEARMLDAEISDRLAEWMHSDAEGAGAAVERLRRHMHDELREEMKMTKRPLFAEIAKGG